MPHQCTTCRRVFPDGSKEMLSGCPDCGGNKFQFRPAGSVDQGEQSGSPGSASTTASAGASVGTGRDESPDPQSAGSTVAETVAGATERVRSLVGSDDAGIGDADDALDDEWEWPAVGREDGADAATDTRDGAGGTPGQSAQDAAAVGSGTEDTAQASARSSVVGPDELPDPPARERDGPAGGHGADDPTTAQATAEEPGSSPASEGDAATAGDQPDEPGSAPFTGSGDRETDSPDLATLREELNDQFESIKIVERGQYELNLMELYDREEYIVSLMEDGRYAIEVPESWRDS